MNSLAALVQTDTTYNWLASLAVLVLSVFLVKVGKYLVFKVPALDSMRTLNQELDAPKIANPKYPPVIKDNERIGLVMNLLFFVAMLPFIATLHLPPVWHILVDTVVLLMVYDFFYYLTHRFLFHGQGPFRRVHALHHQARAPSHIDAYYVHPLETFIGIALFMGSAALCAAFFGRYNVISLSIAFVIFLQLNIVNHTRIQLPYFPFRTLNWIAAKHAVHHENMHKGNYATITLLFDRMFGTLD